MLEHIITVNRLLVSGWKIVCTRGLFKTTYSIYDPRNLKKIPTTIVSDRESNNEKATTFIGRVDGYVIDSNSAKELFRYLSTEYHMQLEIENKSSPQTETVPVRHMEDIPLSTFDRILKNREAEKLADTIATKVISAPAGHSPQAIGEMHNRFRAFIAQQYGTKTL